LRIVISPSQKGVDVDTKRQKTNGFDGIRLPRNCDGEWSALTVALMAARNGSISVPKSMVSRSPLEENMKKRAILEEIK